MQACAAPGGPHPRSPLPSLPPSRSLHTLPSRILHSFPAWSFPRLARSDRSDGSKLHHRTFRASQAARPRLAG